MKRFSLRNQLLLFFVILSSILALFFDILKFYSSIDIQSWTYIHEFLVFLNIIVYYLYLRRWDLFKETNVKVIVKNFSVLLVALYIFILLIKQFFLADFSGDSFPRLPSNISSLLYSNIVSLAAILFFIPMLLLVRNLITSKYRKYNSLFFVIAIGSSAFLMWWTAIFKTIPDISLNFEIKTFADAVPLITNISFIISLVSFFLLSTRTSWVTHLRMREKASFFFISAVLVWMIIYIYDFAFEKAVPAHSLVLGIFANLSWLFLTFYSMMSALNLLVHLPTARVFDRKMNEISSLHDLSRAISVDSDFNTIVKLVIEMSASVLQTRYSWIEVYHLKDQSSKVVASINLQEEDLQALRNRSNHYLNNRMYRDKVVVVINEFLKDGPFNQIREWKSEIESLAAIPIIGTNNELFGVLYTAKTHSFGFDPDDVHLLEAYANQAAIAFENAALLKKSLERERMEQELQIAREVQLRLLPQDTPQVSQLDMDTLTITAYEVGGDYYDFYNNSGDGIGLIIGDVSGKGTSAAFYMAETKGIIQSLARRHHSPAQILKSANEILYPSMEKKFFISMLAAHWDRQKQQLEIARAGHCPVIYYASKTKKTNLLQPPGIALGLDAGPIFDKTLSEVKQKTYPGDILAFYTDGLSEARNKEGEEFGEERLCQVISDNAELPVDDLKQQIIDSILSFLDGQALHDDLTLILAKIK